MVLAASDSGSMTSPTNIPQGQTVRRFRDSLKLHRPVPWYTPDHHLLEVPVWSCPLLSRHCSFTRLSPCQVALAGSSWHQRSKHGDQAAKGQRNANGVG